MPDDARYGILWLGRDALAAAYDLEGAFDSVALTLLRGTAPESVIERLDLLLAPYGGVGAFPRADQISHWFLTSELQQVMHGLSATQSQPGGPPPGQSGRKPGGEPGDDDVIDADFTPSS